MSIPSDAAGTLYLAEENFFSLQKLVSCGVPAPDNFEILM